MPPCRHARNNLALLPHRDRAIIPIEKLRDYALNPDHPKGRDKALVFQSLLGLERRHAEVLSSLLKATLPRAPAQQAPRDKHGQRWTTFHPIIGFSGSPVVVTVGWILRSGDPETPVLISCYIEVGEQERLVRWLGQVEKDEGRT